MGEHRPVRGDGRFGGVLRVAVTALFVVAAGCAALLMVDHGADSAAAARDGGCDRLCAAAGPSGAPGGVAAATNPTHQGKSIARGSAARPAGPGSSGAAATSGGSQSPAKPSASSSSTASSTPSSPAATPTATASPAGHVVPFTVTANWGTGYQVNVIVANDGAATVTDWSLTFRLGGTATLHQVSSANATSGPGGKMVVTPMDWDRILTPGQRVTVNFGFDGAYAPPAPDCVFDGQACTLQVSVQQN